MNKETILEIIEEAIERLNKESAMYLYDGGYISGLIDMAYMTGLITKEEKKMLKERQYNG